MTKLDEIRAHLATGRRLVPLDGKRPIGANWANAWQDDTELLGYFEQHPDAGVGLILGDIVDVEADDEEQEAVYQELFKGIEASTPCFRSTRGWHRFYKAHPRLAALGKAVIYYRKLGIRLGGAKSAQTCVPPSLGRAWTISFDECEPAELPEAVVDRILAELKPVTTPSVVPVREVTGRVAMAVAAMHRMNIEDHNDGSKRLFACCCRAVEHDLTDHETMEAIRQYAGCKTLST